VDAADIRKHGYEEIDTDLLVAMPCRLNDMFHDGCRRGVLRRGWRHETRTARVFWGAVNPLEGTQALD